MQVDRSPPEPGDPNWTSAPCALAYDEAARAYVLPDGRRCRAGRGRKVPAAAVIEMSKRNILCGCLKLCCGRKLNLCALTIEY